MQQMVAKLRLSIQLLARLFAGSTRTSTPTLSMAVAFLFIFVGPVALTASAQSSDQEQKPRARDLGVTPGILSPGPENAITDVAGVRVGQVTLWEGESTRTGVTAILPHGGNIFQEKVPAAIYLGNAFGKLAGSTQVAELGEIETPIILTNTLSVADGVQGALDWTLAQPGNEDVRSANAVVGETNDGFLNDIRARRVTRAHVVQAIEAAHGGPIAEGAVGAGTGTATMGWKGGIGTSSRLLPDTLGSYTVGVLVQTNYGGSLTIMGVPVGRKLGRYYLKDAVADNSADGSVMMIVATDAPLSDRNLSRLAKRAIVGLARTGAVMSNGSGDYVIAFSTAASVRRTPERRSAASTISDLPNDLMSPLFVAVAEATEEAIYNALFAARTVTGHRGTLEALPVPQVMELLEAAGAVSK